MRSDTIKKGPDRAPARAMLRATGLDDDGHRQAAGRRGAHLVQRQPVQPQPARPGQRGRRRHPRRRRHADRVQHHRGHRRHRHGHAGHARLAGQPRGHHRFHRAGRRGPQPGRDGGAVRLRQDHSGRGDGAGAPGYPGRGAVRRQHRPRHAERQVDHRAGRVRGGRRARRRQACRDAELQAGRDPRLPRRRRLRRPVHRQHHGHGADRAGPLAGGPQRHPGHACRTSRAPRAAAARWRWSAWSSSARRAS